MDQNAAPQSETRTETSVLEFRVSRPGIPVRRLRLTGNRYTFGRDPAATVRLDDPALQPLHALMRREVVGDGERLVLQSTSVPLQVNGRLTTETTLHTGDRFQLGEFQFEFIGSIDPPPTSATMEGDIRRPPHERGARAASEDEKTHRPDGKSKPSSPRLSFAAGMRLIDDSNDAADAQRPRRVERTLDAIEQALSAETGRAEEQIRREALRQELEQSLREESRRALDQQKSELSQEHRREMETVLQRFAETQEQAASANRAIESMRQQVADLGKQLRSATEVRSSHQEALQRAARERDAAYEELRHASAQSQSLISELDAARRDRFEISSALHDMTVQLYNATTEGDNGQSRARELERQREEALQKVDSFARRCEELTEQVRQAEQTCQSVSDQRDRFAEQLRQRTEERDSAVALAEQRGDELASKESVINTLRTQVTELEEAVAESRREAETLRTECQAACDSVAKLEDIVRDGEQRRLADQASWESEANELRASVEKISVELAAASSELARSNDSTAALNTELTEAREALAEAESEIEVRPSLDELKAIRERLEATEQQLRDLQADNGYLESASDDNAYAAEPNVAPSAEPIAGYSPEPAAESSPEPTANDSPEPIAESSPEHLVGFDAAYSEFDGAEPAEPNAEYLAELNDETPENVPSPWAFDASNPWNIDSSDGAAPEQEQHHADSAQMYESATEDQMPATEDQMPATEEADENSTAWQSLEESDSPDWEEPTAGSLAGDLLKQLTDSPNADECGDDEDSEQASVGFEVEPAMHEGEIEQVREFLRSDADSTDDEAAHEDENASGDWTYDGLAPSENAELETGARDPSPSYLAVDDEDSAELNSESASGAPTVNHAAAAPEDDDDSIEAYMNRLLQRVQGGSSGTYSPPEKPAPTNSSSKPKPVAREVQAVAPPTPETTAPSDDDAPYVPRSQAPERSKNLAAMRELANNSARTAIMSSVRKQAQSTAMQKFGQAAGCAVGASVMLFYSQMRFGWQMLAAICMTLLAAYWVVEALQLHARLRAEAQQASTVADASTETVDQASDALQESNVAVQEEDEAERESP